jgi:hypothetical protein
METYLVEFRETGIGRFFRVVSECESYEQAHDLGLISEIDFGSQIEEVLSVKTINEFRCENEPHN